MMGNMFRTTNERTRLSGPLCATKLIGVAALVTAGLCVGCGVASTEPGGGSKAQSSTGVSSSGYPGGETKDAESPALASSSEAKYSRDQEPEGGNSESGK